MISVKSIFNPAILISLILLPAYAGVVHKWVDEKGITHYSDEAPVRSVSEITQIELPGTTISGVGTQGGYYSIANQWQRVLKERLERAKLNLEHERLKAIRQQEELDKFHDQEPGESRYIINYRGYKHHHRPFRQSPLNRKHPNKRLMFKDYPPGLHPGRNLERSAYWFPAAGNLR